MARILAKDHPDWIVELIKLRINEQYKNYKPDLAIKINEINTNPINLLFRFNGTPEGWDIWDQVNLGNYEPLEKFHNNLNKTEDYIIENYKSMLR